MAHRERVNKAVWLLQLGWARLPPLPKLGVVPQFGTGPFPSPLVPFEIAEWSLLTKFVATRCGNSRVVEHAGAHHDNSEE